MCYFVISLPVPSRKFTFWRLFEEFLRKVNLPSKLVKNKSSLYSLWGKRKTLIRPFFQKILRVLPRFLIENSSKIAKCSVKSVFLIHKIKSDRVVYNWLFHDFAENHRKIDEIDGSITVVAGGGGGKELFLGDYE